MKNLFILLALASSTAIIAQSKSSFAVSVQQGNQLHHINNGDTISLSKAEFHLQFDFQKGSVVGINASENSLSYLAFKEAVDIDKIECFGMGTGYAESERNEDKDIALGDFGHGYWYYDNAKENRFNNSSKKGEIIHGERNIQHFFYVDLEPRKSVDISQFSGSFIYICVYNKIGENDNWKLNATKYFVLQLK